MLKSFVITAEAGKVFSALANCISLFISSILFAGSVYSQQPLVFVYEPDAWEVGDTISIEFVYGDSQNPVPEANEFHLVHDYSELGYAIDPESTIFSDTTASWICGDCTIDILVDHEQQKIHVWISRDDEEEVGGYGTVLVLRGIISVIDDLHRKPNPGPEKGKSISVSISDQKVYVSQPGTGLLQLIIIDITSGREVLHRNYLESEIKIDLAFLASGVYALVVSSAEEHLTQKFAIR